MWIDETKKESIEALESPLENEPLTIEKSDNPNNIKDTVADKKNCPPCTVLFRKSYKIGFTSSIAMNIMKLGNTVVFGLV